MQWLLLTSFWLAWVVRCLQKSFHGPQRQAKVFWSGKRIAEIKEIWLLMLPASAAGEGADPTDFCPQNAGHKFLGQHNIYCCTSNSWKIATDLSTV